MNMFMRMVTNIFMPVFMFVTSVIIEAKVIIVRMSMLGSKVASKKIGVDSRFR